MSLKRGAQGRKGVWLDWGEGWECGWIGGRSRGMGSGAAAGDERSQVEESRGG